MISFRDVKTNSYFKCIALALVLGELNIIFTTKTYSDILRELLLEKTTNTYFGHPEAA